MPSGYTSRKTFMKSKKSSIPYNSYGGFTLIELLIGITISAMLMAGILVFVSSSLGSTMATKKVLQDANKNSSFEQVFQETLINMTGSGIYFSGSSFSGWYLTGIFLSTRGTNLPITFLGLKTATGHCDSFSWSASATGTIMKIAIRQFTVPKEQNDTVYTLSSTGHGVFSWTIRIIGTGYPGNSLDAGGKNTELNTPSALVYSGGYLYIADTMNDRILTYNTSPSLKSVSKLLGREDGISKPTSLSFSGNTLLIASAGNGKIYSFQDGLGDGLTFSTPFRVAKDFSADTLEFTFSGINSVTSPATTGSFTFSGITKNPDDYINTGASLRYTFSGALPSFASGGTYKIDIADISPAPTNIGNYIVKMDFSNGGLIQYSDVFHYFTKSDDLLATATGNILQTLSDGFIYPHNITEPNTWSGTIDWDAVLWNNPSGKEVISYLPVQDLSFSISGNILTIRYHEYTSYDCILEKHRTEEKVYKILLP